MAKDTAHSLFTAKRILWLAVMAGGLLVALSVAFPLVIFRDSANVYTYMAKALRDGACNIAFHPDIPSLNVLLSYPLTHVGVSPEATMILLSGLFYLGTIPFVYLLTRRFVPDRLAAFGALLFATAPKIIRFSCTGLIDSGKVFFLTMSLYYAYRLIDGKFQSWKESALFGVGLGGLCLARSEGLANSLVLIGCAGLAWIVYLFKYKIFATISRVAVSLSIWICLIFSRMLVFYCVFGEFIYDSRLSKFIERFAPKEATVSAPAATATTATTTVIEVVPNTASVLQIIFQNVRGAYEPYLAAAVLAILLILAVRSARLRRRLWKDGWDLSVWQWRPQYWAMLIVIASNMLVFKIVGVCAYRYFLLNIPMLMVFTLVGLYWIWLWLGHLVPQYRKPLAMVLCGCILAVQAVNGESQQFSKKSRQKYRTGIEAGKIIRKDNPNAKVWYYYASVEWYYTGTQKALEWGKGPGDLRTFADFDYCLWKDNEPYFDIISARQDLQEIPLSEKSSAKLYKRMSN